MVIIASAGTTYMYAVQGQLGRAGAIFNFCGILADAVFWYNWSIQPGLMGSRSLGVYLVGPL